MYAKLTIFALLSLFILSGCKDDTAANQPQPSTQTQTPSQNQNTENNNTTETSIDISNETITCAPNDITCIKINNISPSTLTTNKAITFGIVFPKGAVLNSEDILLQDENGTTFEAYVTKKTTYQNNSLKYAIISLITTNDIPSGNSTMVHITKSSLAQNHTPFTTLQDQLQQIDAKIEIVSSSDDPDNPNKTYSLSLQKAFESNATIWQENSVVCEYIGGDSLYDANGIAHPHLRGEFILRVYKNGEYKIDYIIENPWTYQPNPRNYNYDVKLYGMGNVVYSRDDIIHFDKSRWRKTVWLDAQKSLNTQLQPFIQYNVSYLLNTKAFPSYNKNLIGNINQSELDRYKNIWNNPSSLTYPSNTFTKGEYRQNIGDGAKVRDTITFERFAPMGSGTVDYAMSNVGDRDDIGPLPKWSVDYLLSQDYYAYKIMMANGDAASSFRVHYRLKSTQKMPSIFNIPEISHIRALKNYQYTSKQCEENFGEYDQNYYIKCGTHLYAERNHQPSLNYLPYIVSGDYYQLEEMKFWMHFNIEGLNFANRDYDKGLINNIELRGSAWMIRSLAQTAFILPDDDEDKSYFTTILNNNIAAYKAYYVDKNISAFASTLPTKDYRNDMGWIGNITLGKLQTSPWMDDFFTWAWTYMMDLGFDTQEAYDFLNFKAKFPVSRVNTPGVCWQFASMYHMMVGPIACKDPNTGEDITCTIDNPNKTFFTNYYDIFYESMYDDTNNRPGGDDYRNNTLTTGMNDSEFKSYVDSLVCGSTQMDQFIFGNYLSYYPNGEVMPDYPSNPSGYPTILEATLAKLKDYNITGASSAYNIIKNRATQPKFIDPSQYSYSANPRWAIVPRNE